MEIKIFDITKSVLLVVAIIIFFFYSKAFLDEFKSSNEKTQEQIVKLTEHSIGITGTQANKQEFEALRKELIDKNNKLLKAIEEQQKSTRETLDEIGVIKTEVKQTRKLYEASTKVYDKPGKEEYHYFYKELFIKNKDDKEAKVAWVMFYPNQTEDKQWKYGTFPITAETTVVESENRDGTFNRYAQVEVKDKEGIQIPITLKDIQWEKIPLKDKSFYWWNPRIALTIAATNDIFPGINISLMSYGRTKTDMDWRFLTPGIATDGDEYLVSIEPLSWNIGNVIPLVKNAFIGPIYGYKLNEGTSSIGAQFSIPF